MTTLAKKIPDSERFVGDYLRADPELAALGVRVGGRVPSTHQLPWVRLTQMDARDAGGQVEHLIDFLLQFDCYAGDRSTKTHTSAAEAWITGRTVRAALNALQGQQLETPDGDVVVSDVRFTHMARVPDVGYEPARERIVLNATLHAHFAR